MFRTTSRARLRSDLAKPARHGKTKQLSMLPRAQMAYGGSLLNTRKGRAQGRTLSTRHSMHLVLRSSKARGEWNFRQTKNKNAINRILKRFSAKYGVRLLSVANVGNHLH